MNWDTIGSVIWVLSFGIWCVNLGYYWGNKKSDINKLLSVHDLGIKFEDGRVIYTTGLIDTGNLLKDPLSGKLVVVVDYSVLEPYLSDDVRDAYKDIRNFYDKHTSGLVAIPYSTLGDNSDGIMVGLKVNSIRLMGRVYENVVIGLSTVKNCNYYSIIPGKLLV